MERPLLYNSILLKPHSKRTLSINELMLQQQQQKQQVLIRKGDILKIYEILKNQYASYD